MKKRILPLLSLGLPVLALAGCSEDMSAALADAGQNTLVGMGVVFVILILISFVISGFSLINKAQDNAAKKKEAKLKKDAPVLAEEPAPEAVFEEPEEVWEEEEVTDDLELVAVIAAAIAASENTDPSGIVVRSIRKVSSANHWKRG